MRGAAPSRGPIKAAATATSHRRAPPPRNAGTAAQSPAGSRPKLPPTCRAAVGRAPRLAAGPVIGGVDAAPSPPRWMASEPGKVWPLGLAR